MNRVKYYNLREVKIRGEKDVFISSKRRIIAQSLANEYFREV